MEFTAEEITKMLNDSVAKAIGGNVEEKKEDNTAVKSLEAKVDGLLDFISKNVKIEKPKTMEEHMEEMKKSLTDMIKESQKGDSPDDEKPIDNLTAKSLKEMVASVVKDSLSEIVKTEKPKGQSSEEDAVDELIAGLAKSAGVEMEEDEEEEADEEEGEAKPKARKKVSKESDVAVVTVEKYDDNGNEIPMAKRQAMQKLDNYLGDKLTFEMQKRGIFNDKNED